MLQYQPVDRLIHSVNENTFIKYEVDPVDTETFSYKIIHCDPC